MRAMEAVPPAWLVRLVALFLLVTRTVSRLGSHEHTGSCKGVLELRFASRVVSLHMVSERV